MLQVVGSLLPQTAAAALSPLPIIALIALANRSRLCGFAFTLAWVLTMTAGIGLATAAGSGAASTNPAAAQRGVDWILLAASAFFMYLAYRFYATRPKIGNPEPPKWIRALDTTGPFRDFLFSILLQVTNAKNWPLMIAMGAVVGASSTLSSAEQWGSVVVLGLLSSGSALIIMGMSLFPATQRQLKRLNDFLIRYNSIIMAVMFGFMGFSMLGKALGRVGG